MKQRDPRLVVGAIAVFLVVFVGASVFAQGLFSQNVTCPEDWPLSKSPEVVAHCNSLAQTAFHMSMQTRRAYVSSLPSLTPLPTLTALELAQMSNSIRPTPIPRVVKADPWDFAGGAPNLQRTNSIWIIGVLPSTASYTYITVYVLARPPVDTYRSVIYVTLEGDGMSEQQTATFLRWWEVPMDVGKITITNFSAPVTAETGLVGIVSFTTETGQTGTLDVATGTWTFANDS